MSDQDLELRGLPVGHLPVIRACLELLGVRDVLEQRLPKHPLAKVSDGECVIAMVLNILSGRVRSGGWMSTSSSPTLSC